MASVPISAWGRGRANMKRSLAPSFESTGNFVKPDPRPPRLPSAVNTSPSSLTIEYGEWKKNFLEKQQVKNHIQSNVSMQISNKTTSPSKGQQVGLNGSGRFSQSPQAQPALKLGNNTNGNRISATAQNAPNYTNSTLQKPPTPNQSITSFNRIATLNPNHANQSANGPPKLPIIPTPRKPDAPLPFVHLDINPYNQPVSSPHNLPPTTPSTSIFSQALKEMQSGASTMSAHRNTAHPYRHANPTKQQKMRVQDTPKRQQAIISTNNTCLSIASTNAPPPTLHAPTVSPLVSAPFNGSLSTTQLQNVQQMMMMNQTCHQLNHISLTPPMQSSYPVQTHRIPSLFQPNSFQYVPDQIFEMEMQEQMEDQTTETFLIKMQEDMQEGFEALRELCAKAMVGLEQGQDLNRIIEAFQTLTHYLPSQAKTQRELALMHAQQDEIEDMVDRLGRTFPEQCEHELSFHLRECRLLQDRLSQFQQPQAYLQAGLQSLLNLYESLSHIQERVEDMDATLTQLHGEMQLRGD